MSDIELIKLRQYSIKEKIYKNVLIISCGNFSYSIKKASFKKTIILWYKQVCKKLDWIENDRIKLYFFLKYIEGFSIIEITNIVFNKNHLKDKYYHTVKI